MKTRLCILLVTIIFLNGCVSTMTDYRILPIVYPNNIKTWWDDDRELFIEFTRYTGHSLIGIEAELHTKRPYRVLHIKELKGVVNGKTVIFLKDKAKTIHSMRQLKDGFFGLNETDEFNGAFWLNKMNLRYLLEKININGEYDMDLIQTYSFDDEPLRTQIIQYRVYRLEKDNELPWFMYVDLP
ncbi:hypothetical protein FACS1894130_00210 [Spirochaetia bacterium]|nr:hypothetical protein FACS1894130_00210 [Spirochaetia bacterium]